MNKPKEWYASKELMKDFGECLKKMAIEAINEGKEFNTKNVPALNFAYTDYGGTFYDRAAIKYFEEKHPDSIVWESTVYFGKNAIVFGEIVNEWIESNYDYPLAFRDFEEFYCEYERECEEESWQFFVDQFATDYESETDTELDKDNVLEWLRENKSGHYAVMSSGEVDFCWSDLEKEVKENLGL